MHWHVTVTCPVCLDVRQSDFAGDKEPAFLAVQLCPVCGVEPTNISVQPVYDAEDYAHPNAEDPKEPWQGGPS